jgi:hypothetical protein
MEVPLYSEIAPGLWMGGTDDYDTVDRPSDLPRLYKESEFDAVVTLNAYASPFGWYVKELRYGFPDAPLDANQVEEIEKIAEWAYLEWSQGKKVLVRCQAGMNRSGLVTALILIRHQIKAADAVKLIRKKRDIDALSNSSYLNYLLRER